MTYEQFYKEQSLLARKLNKEERAVKLLLLAYSGFTPSELYLNYHKPIPDQVYQKTLSALNLYFYQNKPVQYLIGYTYFFGLKLSIRPGVLIPRPETELVVEKVLENIEAIVDPKILDLGTGSGAIALALKNARGDAEITATDISDQALTLARENAERLKLKLKFLKSNLFENITESFDVLVSNPPYIDINEDIDPLVRENEPAEALFAEKSGLRFYEDILCGASQVLHNSNLIVFEIPENKDEELIEIVETYYPESNYEIVKDLNNLSRILIIRNNWRKL
jgi:release factor glutamine methyltransferase